MNNSKDNRYLKLGGSYPEISTGAHSKTKNRIIESATKLFAKKGYDAVSMNEIAEDVGIKAGSIYNHFKGKESLWDAVLDNLEEHFSLYLRRLEEENKHAATFEKVVDNMFVELLNVVEINSYYGIFMADAQQFNKERAYEFIGFKFLRSSIKVIQEQFERCIEKKYVPPFDAGTVAVLLMNTVLAGNSMRIHEALGHKTPYDINQVYISLKKFIIDAAFKGSGI